MPIIAAKVTDLGRRFYPSETAFPLEFLARRLEGFAWDQRVTSSSDGWVPLAFRLAGVDWERIFDVFFAIFDERVRPAWPSCVPPRNFLLTQSSHLCPSGRAVGHE